MSKMIEIPRGFFHSSYGIAGNILLVMVGVTVAQMHPILLYVGATVMLLEVLRVAVSKSSSQWIIVRWLRWVNVKIVQKTLTRASEHKEYATIIPSWVGLTLSFGIAPVWITAMTALIFSFVDPCAKFGANKNLEVHRFKSGWAEGKSVGGLLFAHGAGLIAMLILWLETLVWAYMPADISTPHFVLVFLTGALVSPWIELYSGKLDNLVVPLGSTVMMLLVHGLLLLCGV